MLKSTAKDTILDKNQALRHMILQIPALKYILDRLGFDISSYIFIFIGNTLWVLAFIYSNENKLNYVETTFLRGIPVILIHLLIFRILNISIDVVSFQNLKLLSIRNSIMVAQMFVFAVVQFYLPLPIVHNIAATGSIMIFVIDYYKNGTIINFKQIIGTLIGVIGILLVVNNQLVSSIILNKQIQPRHSKFKNYASQDPLIILIMEIALVSITFMYSIGIVMTKDIKTTSLHVGLNLGTLMTFVSGLLYPIIVTAPVKSQTFYLGLLISGAMFAFSQIFYLLALFLNHKTGVLTLFNLLNIAQSYILSIIRYEQELDFFQSAGTIAIVLGVFMTALYQN